MAVYFCDPSSPWQRGSNENTNGLLRQYFPKGKGMAIYTQNQLDEIANKLNARPRKTLGFKTPAEVFEQALHLPVESATLALRTITGANIFNGYWRKPEKTAEEFTKDGWFKCVLPPKRPPIPIQKGHLLPLKVSQ